MVPSTSREQNERAIKHLKAQTFLFCCIFCTISQCISVSERNNNSQHWWSIAMKFNPPTLVVIAVKFKAPSQHWWQSMLTPYTHWWSWHWKLHHPPEPLSPQAATLLYCTVGRDNSISHYSLSLSTRRWNTKRIPAPVTLLPNWCPIACGHADGICIYPYLEFFFSPRLIFFFF